MPRERGYMTAVLVVALAVAACAGDSRPSTADSKTEAALMQVANGPPLPYIARDACPGEGCALGNWIACKDLTAHREPRLTSPVALQLHRGDKFVTDSAEVIVEKAGIIVFTDTVRIGEGEEPLTPKNSTLMTPRDTMYVLDYIGEGYSHAWIRGEVKRVSLMPEPPDRRVGNAMRSIAPVVSTWWVESSAGKASGWIPIEGGDVAGAAPHYEDNPPRCPAPGSL